MLEILYCEEVCGSIKGERLMIFWIREIFLDDKYFIIDMLFSFV